MMIKKWIEFIKESINGNSLYWINENEIGDIFQILMDEEFKISIEKSLYKKDISGKIVKYLPSEDIVSLKESYFPGYVIKLLSNRNNKEDFTTEFRSSISQLSGEGYDISICDEDGTIGINHIYITDGYIIVWIPEVEGSTLPKSTDDIRDGDIQEFRSQCDILICQRDVINLTETTLAEFYNWECDKIENGKIYCHIDAKYMANIFLYPESSYKKFINGDDIDYIDDANCDYDPDIISLFDYYMNDENRKLCIKALIKDNGGVEEIAIKLENNELKNLSEEETTVKLLSERFYKSIKLISSDSDIISDISQIVGDYIRYADHIQSIIDIERAFDKKISDESIEFKKFKKKSKDGYDTNWCYEIHFDIEWIENSNVSISKCPLSDVFFEWSGNQYFRGDISPYFSDHGDVNQKDLDIDIKSLIIGYLK